MAEAKPTLLIVGKTGSGKRSTANTIFGQDLFKPAHSVNSNNESNNATKKSNEKISIVCAADPQHKRFQGQMHTDENEEVDSWLDNIEGEPNAIVYVIRCDKRFTREDYDLYQLLKKNERLKKMMPNKMVLVFTFGDKLFGRDLHQILESDNPYVKSIQEMCNDAGGKYLVFDNKTKDQDLKVVQAKALMEVVNTKQPHPFPQHVCRLLIVANTTERGEIMKRLRHKSPKPPDSRNQTYQVALLMKKVYGFPIEITFVEEHPQASEHLKKAVKVAISPGPHAICASPQQSELVSQLLDSSADDLRQYTMDQKVDWNDFPNGIYKEIVEPLKSSTNGQRRIFFQSEELKKIDEEIHDETERIVEGRLHSVGAFLNLSDSPYNKRLLIKQQRVNKILKHPIHVVENTLSE